MANMISMSDLSRGLILEIGGSLWTILEYQNFKTGKGNSEARMRMKLRDIKTGYTQDRTFRTDEKVAKAAVESRGAQFTYDEDSLYHFMDMETYDEQIVSADLLGQGSNYLVEGMEVELLMHNDTPVSLQLPITVDLTIADTEPGFKGDTASASNKKATLETGLSVDVPMFVNPGDKVKIDTRSASYISRV